MRASGRAKRKDYREVDGEEHDDGDRNGDSGGDWEGSDDEDKAQDYPVSARVTRAAAMAAAAVKSTGGRRAGVPNWPSLTRLSQDVRPNLSCYFSE